MSVLTKKLGRMNKIKTNVKVSPTSKLDRKAKLVFLLNQPGLNEICTPVQKFRQTVMSDDERIFMTKCFHEKTWRVLH